jgi:hypothetical protein
MNGNGTRVTVAGFDRATKIDYVLQVDLVVAKEDAHKFEVKVDEFLATGGFGRIEGDPHATSRLLLALKRDSAFPYNPDGIYDDCSWQYPKVRKPRPAQKACHYVHLWHVDNAEELDLAARMKACADDTAYAEIDSLVLCEIQDFVRQVRWNLPPFSPAGVTKQTHFVRTVRRFPSCDLGIYLFRKRGIFRALNDKGWRLVGQFQSVTGALNTVHECWQAPEQHANGEDLHRRLANDEKRAFLALRAPAPLRNTKAAVAKAESDMLAMLNALSATEGRSVFSCPGYYLNQLQRNKRRP